MQLMPGETVIAQLAGVTLTTQRVQLEVSQWGSKKVTTITLDNLTSCDIESESKPILLVLGAVVLVFALMSQFTVLLIGVIPLFLGWFFTRRKNMVLRSASEKIERSASLGQWKELQAFIHSVQTAKANHALGITGRNDIPTLPPRDVPLLNERTVEPRTQPAVTTQSEYAAVSPVRPAFWTAPATFTFDSSALSASAAAVKPQVVPPIPKTPPDASAGTSPSSEMLELQKTIASARNVDAGFTPIQSNEKRYQQSTVTQVQSAVITESPSKDRDPSSEPSLMEPSVDKLPPGDARTAEASSPRSRGITLSPLAVGVCIVITAAAVFVAVFALVNFSERKSQSSAQTFSTKDQEAIRNTIGLWAKSFREKDTATHVGCYAPVVETYFRRHDVAKVSLQRDKERAFADMTTVKTYDITDIRITTEPDGRLSATFHKDWDTPTIEGKPFSGSEIEKLTFANYSGEWKIVKEQELEILRVFKGTMTETNSATHQ